MKRKWNPVVRSTKETDTYRYEFGFYDHDEYGRCFRVAKFLRSNGYFVGHFVLVPSDLRVFEDIWELYQEHIDEHLPLAAREQIRPPS